MTEVLFARRDEVSAGGNVDVTNYGAICDGVTDDAPAIRAAFTAAVALGRTQVTLPDRTCLCKSSITLPSNTTLSGIGGFGRRSVLKAHSSLAGSYLLKNGNQSSYVDSNITIKDLTIDGNNLGAGATQTIFNGLLGFGFVTNFTMENVKLYNYNYTGLELISAVKSKLIHNEFTTLGYTDHGVGNNGGSVFISTNTHLSPSTDILVEGNNFHDCNAMTFAAVSSIVTNNIFRNMGEVAINYPYVPPEVLTKNNIISNNVFDGSHLLSVSASCIEAEGYATQFLGNSFRNCGHDGIVLVNAQDILVEGNTFSNVGQEAGFSASSAGVKIFSSAASPNQPQNITIQGNHVYDDQGTPTTGAGVQLTYTGGGSTPVINLSIVDNDFSKTAFVSGTSIKENTAGIIGAGSIIRNNLPTTINRALPAAEGGTGLTALGAGVATWLGAPTSVNIWNAVTDRTGTTGGALVFNANPSFVNTTFSGTFNISGQDQTAAWTAYSPVVTCSAGAVVNHTTTGRYQQFGKTIRFQITTNITNIGTCAGELRVSLPSAVVNGVTAFTTAGYNSTSGYQIQGIAQGSSTYAVIQKYDASSEATNGIKSISGEYEAG